ncbi:MAG: HNH endonuclease [Anaerolineae bacterium]|nr:HNH endonuclease [Anaerolineae bacterium]
MTYIPAKLREQVIDRAGGCCEYCRVSQEYSDVSFHIEHIIAISHGGKTLALNLALSCLRCNLLKGTNIAAADPLTDEPTFLFHPRRHHWNEHFQLNGPVIEPLTAEGRATVFVLRLNDQERIEQRTLLLYFDRYPCPEIRLS